jgi:hypothetical protein
MKVTKNQLRRLIREQVSRYTTSSDRAMTPQEAHAKARELSLQPEVVDYIVKEFQRHEDEGEFSGGRGMGYGQVGTDGRLSWGQSWEGVLEELAEAMGFDEDDAWQAEEIFHQFFEE